MATHRSPQASDEASRRAKQDAILQRERRREDQVRIELERLKLQHDAALVAEQERQARAETDRKLTESLRRAADDAAALAEEQRRRAERQRAEHAHLPRKPAAPRGSGPSDAPSAQVRGCSGVLHRTKLRRSAATKRQCLSPITQEVIHLPSALHSMPCSLVSRAPACDNQRLCAPHPHPTPPDTPRRPHPHLPALARRAALLLR